MDMWNCEPLFFCKTFLIQTQKVRYQKKNEFVLSNACSFLSSTLQLENSFCENKKLSAPHYKQHYKRFRNSYQRKGSPSRRSRSSLNLAPSSTLKSSDPSRPNRHTSLPPSPPSAPTLPPTRSASVSYKTNSAAKVFAVPQSSGIPNMLTNEQGRRDPVIPWCGIIGSNTYSGRWIFECHSF